MSNKENTMNDIEPIVDATEECLNEWVGNGNLQFPTLLLLVATKLGLDEKQQREADGIIRFHVRRSEDFYVTRGAKGGIMRMDDRKKKEAAKIAKATAKAEIKSNIEQKVAAIPKNIEPIEIVTEDPIEDEEDLIEEEVFGDE